jgi:hypothetical protein
MTDLDYCAQMMIETSSKSDILVKIDDIFVKKTQLSCLLGPEKFLNDDVSNYMQVKMLFDHHFLFIYANKGCCFNLCRSSARIYVA